MRFFSLGYIFSKEFLTDELWRGSLPSLVFPDMSERPWNPEPLAQSEPRGMLRKNYFLYLHNQIDCSTHEV